MTKENKSVPMTINFKLEKETPGAVRFFELDDAGHKRDIASGAAVATLYVRKTALQGTPKSLKVTITPEY